VVKKDQQETESHDDAQGVYETLYSRFQNEESSGLT